MSKRTNILTDRLYSNCFIKLHPNHKPLLCRSSFLYSSPPANEPLDRDNRFNGIIKGVRGISMDKMRHDVHTGKSRQ